jgi:hypothetical protein
MSTELGKIWVFDESKLDEALDRYRQASVQAYPHQQEKINVTLLAIRDFLDSEFAEKLTMNVKVTDSHRDDD